MYLEPEHQIVYKDSDVLAVRQNGRVEVWSADGETNYGNIAGPNAADRHVVMAVWRSWSRGFDEGMKAGADGARSEMRAALGLS